jgi:putative RNA 2'-phosphotransferase
MPIEREPLARTLAHLLRHEPWVHGVELDSQGWADLDLVVERLRARRYPELTREEVVAAVKEDPRDRFEIRKARIRARYGHSVPVQAGPIEEPPKVLYAAVPRATFRDAALEGLKPPKGRAFVHLAEKPEEARAVAQRRDPEPVLLEVKAQEAARSEGLEFRHAGDLWLVERMPSRYLEARG